MSRKEGRDKMKINRTEANITGDPCSHLEVKGIKVKVTGPINAVTAEISHIFATGRPNVV